MEKDYLSKVPVLVIAVILSLIALYWFPKLVDGLPISNLDLLADVRNDSAAFLRDSLGNLITIEDSIINSKSKGQVAKEGVTSIADMSNGSSGGMVQFYEALYQSQSRPVRIAVLGDSYIEGDIMTSKLRQLLQERFGGKGVGYIPMTSITATFSPTCRHSFGGWTPEIAEVTGDVVYKATYTKTKREYRDLKVAISWIDEDDRDGIRPESYTLEFYTSDLPDQELTFSEENGWSMTLQVPLRDVKGKPISFGFNVTHPDGYRCFTNQSNAFSYVFVFTHEPATVDLTVKKVWDDLGNAYGTRPDELKVSLSDGTKTVKEVTLNAENGWSATVTDLPMYQNHGQEVVYSWTEEVVTGYKLSKNVTEGNVTTLTNKLETVTISGQVKWEMNGYSKSLIPDGVNVLILEVGEQVDSIAVPRVDSETVWEYTSKELPKYTSGGDEITYTVGLESIPAGFDVQITGTEIVFTYQPVMTTIKGTVVWDLKDNEEDLIPDEVAVDIYDENSELVDQLTVTPDENGKWSFTSIELPKFREDGETEIAYRLESNQKYAEDS